MNNTGREPKPFMFSQISRAFWGFVESGGIFAKALFLWSLLLLVNVSIYFALSKVVIPSSGSQDYIASGYLELFLAVIKIYILCGILGCVSLVILKILQNGLSDTIIYLAIVLGCFNAVHVCLFFTGNFLTLAPLFLIIGITNVTILLGHKMGSFTLLCSVALYVAAIIFQQSGYIQNFPIATGLIVFNQIFTQPTIVSTFGVILTLALVSFGSLVVYITKLLNQRTEEIMRANVELETSYQKLKELDTMKTNFLSMISHDLRTPLTSIKGYTSLLLNNIDQFDKKEGKEFLDIVDEESDHLIRLISNLLDLQSLEAGRTPFNFQDLDMVKVIEESLESLKEAADKKNLRFEKELPREEVHLKADRDLLSKAVANLLSNGIKFSPEGELVKIRVELTNENGNSVVKVSFWDAGPVVPKEFQATLFDKFQPVDRAGQPIEKRSGLGLSIVKEIIERHGGKVGVKSEAGEGNIFYFVLPI